MPSPAALEAVLRQGAQLYTWDCQRKVPCMGDAEADATDDAAVHQPQGGDDLQPQGGDEHQPQGSHEHQPQGPPAQNHAPPPGPASSHALPPGSPLGQGTNAKANLAHRKPRARAGRGHDRLRGRGRPHDLQQGQPHQDDVPDARPARNDDAQ